MSGFESTAMYLVQFTITVVENVPVQAGFTGDRAFLAIISTYPYNVLTETFGIDSNQVKTKRYYKRDYRKCAW